VVTMTRGSGKGGPLALSRSRRASGTLRLVTLTLQKVNVSEELVGSWFSVTHRQVHSSLPKVNFTELVEFGECRSFRFDLLKKCCLTSP
jgi:hypothetical protein